MFADENQDAITKDNLLLYLKELGKEYRRLVGTTTPAEIVLVGGAAVLANYGFRAQSGDIDASSQAASALEDAAIRVRDRFGLPNDWFNADFQKTDSYSPFLSRYSEYFRTYSNVLNVRTVTREYLIAMKLMSFRQYKHDRSDIIGILRDEEQNGTPVSFDQIDRAAYNLYGGWNKFPEGAKDDILRVLEVGHYDEQYELCRAEEENARSLLEAFSKKYPNVLTRKNVNSVLADLMRLDQASDHSDDLDER